MEWTGLELDEGEKHEIAEMLSRHMKTRASTLMLAQQALENMPMGGVGDGGPSLLELAELDERGTVIEGDAAYHQAQKAWLLIDEVLKDTP